MAVSNLTVSQIYDADGVTDTFAIPFQYIAGDGLAQVRVVLIDDDTQVETLQAITTDYTLDPDNLNPTNVIFVTPPADGFKVLVERSSALEQVIDFLATSSFPAESNEEGLDRLLLMIQELAASLSRKIEVSRLDAGTINLKIPPGEAGFFLRINEAGDGLEWVDLGDGSSGGGLLPSGATEAAVLEVDATDTPVWSDPIIYSGISALTGAPFSSLGIKDTLDKIIRITYTPPVVSLSGTGSGTLRERGDTVTNPTLSANITRQSDDILDITFYDGAIDPLNIIGSTIVSGPAIPGGGTQTQATAVSFSTNRTFRVRVRDNGDSNGGTPQNSDAAVTYNFVYPYYVGAGSPGLSAAAVAGLTKRIITESTDRTEVISATVGQVFYFAYPASYGTLSSILDENNFETIGDWTLRVENITGLDGNPVSYNIYEFDNPVGVSDSYQYRFRQ